MRILLLHGGISTAGMGATAVTTFRQKGDGLRDNFSYYRALFTGSPLPYESSGALLVFAIVLAGIPAYFIWNAAHSKRS